MVFMNVIAKIIEAAARQDTEKFENLLARLNHAFNPLGPQAGAGLASLTLVLSQVNDEDFHSIAKMAWNSENRMFGYERPTKDRLSDAAIVLMTVLGVAAHTDRNHLLPQLMDEFVANHTPNAKLGPAQLKTNLLKKWISQAKLIDWSSNTNLYNQLKVNAADDVDDQVAYECSRCGHAAVLTMLHRQDCLSDKAIAYHVFYRVERAQEWGTIPINDDDRLVASLAPPHLLLDTLFDESEDSMLKESGFRKFINDARTLPPSSNPSPNQKDFFEVFIDLANPIPAPHHLDILETWCTPKAKQLAPSLEPFVQKHRLLKQVNADDHSSKPRPVM